MLVLGIETTCDDASASLVEDGRKIISHVIASQINLHKRYGGVFPEYASRRHVDSLLPVINETLKQANITYKEIDLIGVAHKPGLIGSLLIGLTTAKSLSFAWNIPFIGVDHLFAHIYAAMMSKESWSFPCLGVVLSGGHTSIFKLHTLHHYETIGFTIDDAIGESFDKVATLLGLTYPGGPEIERLAKEGDERSFPLHPCVVKGNPLLFSFSGLKTKILYLAKGQNSTKHDPLIITEKEKGDLAASFQRTVFLDVVEKTLLACHLHECKEIYLGGGVTNNVYLKKLFQEKTPADIPVHFPGKDLSLDNGAMIAGLGFHLFKKSQKGDPYDMVCIPKY